MGLWLVCFNSFQDIVDFGGIWTHIFGLESKYADHLTITTTGDIGHVIVTSNYCKP